MAAPDNGRGWGRPWPLSTQVLSKIKIRTTMKGCEIITMKHSQEKYQNSSKKCIHWWHRSELVEWYTLRHSSMKGGLIFYIRTKNTTRVKIKVGAFSSSGMSNVRPAGRMRPANGFNAAREMIFSYVMHVACEMILAKMTKFFWWGFFFRK